MPCYSISNKYADDIEDVQQQLGPYKLGDPINDKDIFISKNIKPTFSYDLIDLGTTNYNFCREEFDNADIKEYFKIVKELSTKSIQSIIEDDNKRRALHFYRSNVQGNLLAALRLLNGSKSIRPENYPEVYHFALFTKEKASATTKEKSPRIYFIVGSYGRLYIVFYDPYHELNPVKL